MSVRVKHSVTHHRPVWKKIGAALALVGVMGSAYAWDGAVTGYISQLDTVNESNNYELRVYLGGATMCNVSYVPLATWAYLNSSDANYTTAVANLMMAYSMGKQVTIYTMNDGGVGCHIHYVTVRG